MDDSVDQKTFHFINSAKLLAEKYNCIISGINLMTKTLEISGKEEDKKLLLEQLSKFFE